MADVKISALPAGSALAGTEVAPFVQSSTTVKITGVQIATYVTSTLGSLAPLNAAPAGTLTGTTLNATVVTTSITSTGTLISGATGSGFTVALGTSTITGTLSPANGGTGVANNASSTITISGNFGLTFTITNTTNATLPVGTVSLGYLGIPQNIQSATYTLVLADAGKHIYMNSAGAFNIPANGSVAFPIGTAVTFVNPSTDCTITITTDTLQSTLGTGTRTLAQFGVATIIKVTSTVWYITGNGLT